MPTPRDNASLPADELETWAAFATVLEMLPTALDAQLQRDSGLTHFEFGVMFALADAADRTLRMSVLAAYSNSSLSRLSRAVSRLEAKQWVTRSPDPTDGRYTLATLSVEGVAKVEQATPGHVETVRRLVFEALTPTEARQLRDISRRVIAAIGSQGGWQPSAP
jgi:DNA-binding MarR family transcriptional regulator